MSKKRIVEIVTLQRTHLINLVPLWVDSLVDHLALEEFCPDSEDAVGV